MIPMLPKPILALPEIILAVTAMTLMMVGLVTAEGIGKQLDPDANSFQEVTNYLLPVLARRGMLSDRTIEQMAEAALRQLQSG